jgi:hypothetical protein
VSARLQKRSTECARRRGASVQRKKLASYAMPCKPGPPCERPTQCSAVEWHVPELQRSQAVTKTHSPKNDMRLGHDNIDTTGVHGLLGGIWVEKGAHPCMQMLHACSSGCMQSIEQCMCNPSAHTHTAVASDLTLLIARVSLQHAIVVDMKRRGACGSEAQDPERREMHRSRRGARCSGCAVAAVQRRRE